MVADNSSIATGWTRAGVGRLGRRRRAATGRSSAPAASSARTVPPDARTAESSAAASKAPPRRRHASCWSARPSRRASAPARTSARGSPVARPRTAPSRSVARGRACSGRWSGSRSRGRVQGRTTCTASTGSTGLIRSARERPRGPGRPAARRGAGSDPMGRWRRVWGSSCHGVAGPRVGATSDRYTPAPEPRADWARSWDDTPPVTPERWYEPAPTPVPRRPAARTRAARGRRRSLLAASLLSALLASGGTVLALGAAGALDRPVAAVPTAPGDQRRRAPAGRHRRVVGDDRRGRQGQPGRRAHHGHRHDRRRQPRRHPADRRRVGRHLRQQRLDPDQPPRRRGRREVRRRAQGRARPAGHASTASTR